MLGWALAAFAVAICMVTFNNSGMVLREGLLAKAFAAVIGTLLRDSICRFVRPSSVLTSGRFFRLVFTKLSWIAGPQVVGLFIGVALGMSQVLSRI